MKKLKYLLSVFIVFTALNMNSAFSQLNNNIVVMVKYQALPGKDSVCVAALESLINKVKQEPGYLSIVIHQDPSNKSNILLYEQWANEAYYKGDHLKTPHLQQFMKDSRSFLAGPPDISFWKIKEQIPLK